MEESKVVPFGKPRVPEVTDRRPLAIARGRTVRETKITNSLMTWSELLSRLSNAIRAPEPVAEFMKLSKDEQTAVKDRAGYWIAGKFNGSVRKSAELALRDALALDADNADANFLMACEMVLGGHAYAIHSTHKSTPQKPRYRLIVPLSRSIGSTDEYEAVARMVAHQIGIEYFDDTTYQAGRAMFWPSCTADVPYEFHAFDGDWINPDTVLARYKDWHDWEQWPRSSQVTELVRAHVKKVGDPLTKPGLIGAFNHTYTIHEAIEQFLQHVYTPLDGVKNRYTFVGGTTAGGAIVYDNDRILYSFHSTDPCHGQAMNAFDLVRVHLYGAQDHDQPGDAQVSKLPSFLAMQKLAQQDETVRATIYRRAAEDFKPITEQELPAAAPAAPDAPVDQSWRTQLSVTRGGALEATRENYRTILLFDPLLKGRIRYNEFIGQLVALDALPWRKIPPTRDGTWWTDADDAGLRHYIETAYSALPVTNLLEDALKIVAEQSKFHPVRDYLNTLKWDGQPRLDDFLCRYMGARDDAYTRTVSRIFFTAAVARIYKPGIKFDHALIFVGAQNKGKSLLVDVLGGEWASDSLYTVQGKEAYEQIQGVWMIEMAELTATRRADVEHVKHFLTKRKDRFRPAYGRRVIEWPRQCIFLGSTNDIRFLHDKTGNRRFWPIKVAPLERAHLWVDKLRAERDQILAEAKHHFEANLALYLPEDIEAMAAAVQEEHRADDGLLARIEHWLNQPVPDDWNTRTLVQRQLFYDLGKEAWNGPLLQRDRVCAREVFIELLGGDEAQFNQPKAREINETLRLLKGWTETASLVFSHYGRTRGFLKGDL